MRFGLIHRIMTDALAALGLLALLTSGELSRTAAILLAGGIAIAITIPESWQTTPPFRRASSIIPAALLAIEFLRLLLGTSSLTIAIEFAAALQVIRVATRRGAAHDQQIIVLALLHLIAGTVLGGGLAYGLCFLGFTVVAPGALVLSHLRREVEGNYRQGARDRTGLPVDVPRILRSRRVVDRRFVIATCFLSIPICIFTACLFLVFPRIGLSLLLITKPRPGRMIGFADKVDLGQVGTLRTDPTLVLRVETPDLPSPPPRLAMHLRGAAFDTYNGRTWSRTIARHDPALRDGTTVIIRRPPDPLHDRTLRLDLEPIDPPVLFLPLGSASFSVRRRTEPAFPSKLEIWSGPEGEFRYTGADEQGLRYTVYLATSRDPHPALSPADFERYIALPSSTNPKLHELATSIVPPRGTVREKALSLEAYLRANYKYDLASPSGQATDPLFDFLFVSQRGHCEYYSTAMVVLLRELRIPSRNVTGFIGGTYNRFGHYYAVRQGDAHSWVEVYLPESGWQTFDPTPPGDAEPKPDLSDSLALVRDVFEAMAQRWNRYVVGYDLHQQVYLLDSLSRYRQRTLPWTPSHFRPSLLLWPLATLAAGALAAFLHRHLRRHRPQEHRTPTSTARVQLWATELYESLDIAMSALGIPRTASTPPLQHASALQALGHPLAPEILDLTQVYLEARFGGLSLPHNDQRLLEARVRRLRFRPAPDHSPL